MTTPAPLRAHVYRDQRLGGWHIDVDDPWATSTWTAIERSWPEAMQRAYLMLRDLDRFLMFHQHDHRAARREQRCSECHDVVQSGKAHWKISEGPCMILDADTIDPDTAEATYTLGPLTIEATA